MTNNTSDKRVLRAIEANEDYLIKHPDDSLFTDYGLSIKGCEKRNLEEFKEMIGKDKRTLKGFTRELYQAI